MLEGPATHVLAERLVERLGAEDLLAQLLQADARLEVRGNPEELRVDPVRSDVDRLVDAGLHHLLDDAALLLGARHLVALLGIAPRLGEGVDEGVEALVLPHPHALVRGDDHREPHVADLVGHDVVEVVHVLALRFHRDHRVFHAGDRAFDRRDVRPRILEPALRIFLDRHPRLVGGVGPVGSSLRAIVAVGHDPLPAAGIPLILGRGSPDGVADILRRELPGHHPRGPGTCRTAGEFGGSDDPHHAVGLGRLGQPRDLRRGQHLAGILQRTGRGDDVAGRERDRQVVVAEVEVELALPEVGLDVPAAHVIVDGDAGIPLRNLVERTVAAHPVGTVLRHQEVIGNVERGALPRRQRLGEEDLGHRLVVTRLHRHPTARRAGLRPSGHLLHLVEDVAALEAARAEARVLRVDVGVERVRLEGVLLGLQPDVGERVRRVVGVAERHRRLDALGGGVERRGDVIVGAVLPVAHAGPAAAGAILVGRRQHQRREDRRVGNGQWRRTLLRRRRQRRDHQQEERRNGLHFGVPRKEESLDDGMPPGRLG